MKEQTGATINNDMYDNHNSSVIRILVVDDSDVIRNRLGSLISDTEGIELAGEANDALEAIQLFHTISPDTVILDLRMPGSGGISVLREIKQINPATEVIILTNYPYDAYRKRCTELGADHFLDKSTEFDKIKNILRRFPGGTV